MERRVEMKLRAKILRKYLEEILRGKKKIEYRQVESIILVDEQGKEYEFEVTYVQDSRRCATYPLGVLWYVKRNYPELQWDDNLPTIAIELGRRIK